MTTDLNAYLPSASSGDGLTIAKPLADGMATSPGSWEASSTYGYFAKSIATGNSFTLTLTAGDNGSILTHISLDPYFTSSTLRLTSIVLDGVSVFDRTSLGMADSDCVITSYTSPLTSTNPLISQVKKMPFYSSCSITFTGASGPKLVYAYSDLA